MYYIKIIEWKDGEETKPKYIGYFDIYDNTIYYCENSFDAQCYLSFESMQKEFEALKEYYAKNKIAIYKIIIEYEF